MGDAGTEIVLLGGGHAHLEVLLRFARTPVPGTRLTLIAREVLTPYSGMLPGLIRGEYAFADAHVDLAPLAAAAGARLILAEADGIDLATGAVTLAGRPPIGFDLLSINVGGAPVMPPGAGVAVKPIGQFLDRLAALRGSLPRGARVAVVGGGAGGTELALALRRGLPQGLDTSVVLVCREAEPLAGAPAAARRIVRAALVEAGVELVCGAAALGSAHGRLSLSDGSFLDVDAALWATGAVAPAFLAESGLATDAAGGVRVAATLRSLTDPRVFAAGDCAAIEGAPRPKAGVWAVRAGAVLAENLRRAAVGRRLRAWRPPSYALAILGLGHGRAVAWRGGWALSGRVVWRWKDRIDRRWTARFRGLPALATLLPVPAAASSVVSGVGMVQVLIRLGPVLDDPFVLGEIAAAHALGPIAAAGATPGTASAIVTAPTASDRRNLRAGVAAALGATGYDLDDVQECAGATDLVLALTGRTDPSRRPGPPQGGDVLLLTRPLGGAAILRAQRAGMAQGLAWQAAIGAMRGRNARAVLMLAAHGMRACTAVGAAGLAGAAAVLLEATGLGARIDPDALPTPPGLSGDPAAWVSAPQIAGGLLAAVPADRASACLAELRQTGMDAARVGVLVPMSADEPALAWAGTS